MAQFDESSMRYPEFSGGHPIVLADGQEWYFADPDVALVSAIDLTGARVTAAHWTFGKHRSEHWDIFMSQAFHAVACNIKRGEQSGGTRLWARWLIEAGYVLFGYNYDVIMDVYLDIFGFDPDDEDGKWRLLELLEHVNRIVERRDEAMRAGDVVDFHAIDPRVN